MKKMKAAELIEDFDLYPRKNVNAANVSEIATALAAGVEMPPVIIDKASKVIVDGVHRTRAHLRCFGDDAEVDVVAKQYKSKADMFLDAMRLNASHGYKLDTYDRAHCLLISERLHIPLDAVAGALHIPADKLGALRSDRTATNAAGLAIPLKRTIRQWAGRKLNKRQVEANDKLSGMNQVFYANQLIELIEADLLDKEDDELQARLSHLYELLSGILVSAQN